MSVCKAPKRFRSVNCTAHTGAGAAMQWGAMQAGSCGSHSPARIAMACNAEEGLLGPLPGSFRRGLRRGQ